MRVTHSLARLLDSTFQWGLEFGVISNSFQQKEQQWHFLAGHFSQAVRPGADQGSSEVFQFEQMNPRVANLGTRIPLNCSAPCDEKGFHPTFLTVDHLVQRALPFLRELRLLLEPQALFLSPTPITHLQSAFVLTEIVQSCMPSSESKNTPCLESLYIIKTFQMMQARGKCLFYHHADNPSKMQPRKLQFNNILDSTKQIKLSFNPKQIPFPSGKPDVSVAVYQVINKTVPSVL